jgi:hypothetical protein
MAVSEMGPHGRSLLVCHSIIEDTMAGTVVAGFGGYVFGSRPDQRHDDVPNIGKTFHKISC